MEASRTLRPANSQAGHTVGLFSNPFMPHTLRNCYPPGEISGFFFFFCQCWSRLNQTVFWFFLCVKNGNFADPDKESLLEKDTEVTSQLSKEPCPCHVRSHLHSNCLYSTSFWLMTYRVRGFLSVVFRGWIWSILLSCVQLWTKIWKDF